MCFEYHRVIFQSGEETDCGQSAPLKKTTTTTTTNQPFWQVLEEGDCLQTLQVPSPSSLRRLEKQKKHKAYHEKSQKQERSNFR